MTSIEHNFTADNNAEKSTLDVFQRYEQFKWRGFQLSSYGIVLEPEQHYEIIEASLISQIPGINRLCKGLLNHRNKVIPVYDLWDLDDGEPISWDRNRVLLLHYQQDAIGIMLYHLPEEITIDDKIDKTSLSNVPSVLKNHVQEAYFYNDQLWLLFDFEKLFLELSESSL